MNAQATAADQSVFCAHCDMPNATDAAYCAGCGTGLRAGAQPQPAPADAPLARRCGTCGITNPNGALFCVNCGITLADPQPRPAREYARSTSSTPAGTTVDMSIAQHIYIGAPPTRAEVPLLARALWFIFVGLWAGQFWLITAWLLNLTLIGLPLGMWMLSRLPQVMTLRSTPIRRPAPVGLAQSTTSFAVRAVYFVLIGWWVSLLWMELAWLIAASLIGLPLSFLMFERVATLTTLAEA
jgi:uncharacterized membrane protein YccF (DUF307 family)